jgi:hypothetical protein
MLYYRNKTGETSFLKKQKTFEEKGKTQENKL